MYNRYYFNKKKSRQLPAFLFSCVVIRWIYNHYSVWCSEPSTNIEGIIRKSIHPLGLAVLLALAPTAYAADTQGIEKGKEQVKETGVFIGQQIEVIDKNSRYGDMPADNAAAGLAAAEDLNNKYIREIKVGETLFGDKMPGAVTATFYNDEPTNPELRGKKISIMPINSRYQ